MWVRKMLVVSEIERIDDQMFGPGDTVVLDNKMFSRCTFDGAKVVYSGSFAGFEECSWGDCTYVFTEAAYRTGGLLAQIGFLKDGVEAVFREGSKSSKH